MALRKAGHENLTKIINAYNTLKELIVHAEQSRWTRFNSLVVFNSIMILAWSTLNASELDSNWIRIVQTILCSFGLLASWLWSILGWRTCQYFDHYRNAAKKMENGEHVVLPKPFNIKPENGQKFWPRWKKWRNDIPTSSFIVKIGPWCFAILFIFLIVVSWVQDKSAKDYQKFESITYIGENSDIGTGLDSVKSTISETAGELAQSDAAKLVVGLESIKEAIETNSQRRDYFDSLILQSGSDSSVSSSIDRVAIAIEDLSDNISEFQGEDGFKKYILIAILLTMIIGLYCFYKLLKKAQKEDNAYKQRALWISIIATFISLASLGTNITSQFNQNDNSSSGSGSRTTVIQNNIWFERLLDVKSFEPGKEIPSNMKSINLLVNDLNDKLINNELVAMELIGCTDRELLQKPLRDKYGYNSGLAYARAKCVRDSIVAKFTDSNEIKIDTLNIRIGITGPNAKDSLHSDRRVEVYTWWKKKKQSKMPEN